MPYLRRGTWNIRRSSGAKKPGDLIRTIFIISTPYYVGFGKEKFLRQAGQTLQGNRKMLWAGSAHTPRLRRRRSADGRFFVLIRWAAKATPPFANRICTALEKRSYAMSEVRKYVFDQWMDKFEAGERDPWAGACRGRRASFTSRTGCMRRVFCAGCGIVSQSARRNGSQRWLSAHAGISQGTMVHDRV